MVLLLNSKLSPNYFEKKVSVRSFFLLLCLLKRKNRTMYCAIFEDLESSVGDVGSIVEGAASHKFSQEGGGRHGIERHRGEIRDEFA